MGWLWNNDDPDYIPSSSRDINSEHCSTRKVVSSQCRTEEVEPGKFIRKCEKTEQIFKDCVGRPSEMIQSNKEYTEEDVTDQRVKDLFPLESGENISSYFPGLRSDIEAIKRSSFGGIGRFFEAAEDMKNEFFRSVGTPNVFDKDGSSSGRRGVRVEGVPRRETPPKNNSHDGDVDLFGLAEDV